MDRTPLDDRDVAILGAMRDPYGTRKVPKCSECRGRGTVTRYTADCPGGQRGYTCKACGGSGIRDT
jgi:DnaJ-class molecular chaperone